MSRRAKSNPSGANRSPAASSPTVSRSGNLSPPQVKSQPGWLSFAAGLFLALAVWAVFAQTLHHNFINCDDPSYVYENHHVLTGVTPENLSWALATHIGTWQPLVWLSFMIDYQLHGLKAGGFHMTNMLLHIANTLLLLVVLSRMGGGLWRSLFVAALFAIHPLHVESVAWVTERKDVLSALFWMLTMWGYLRYIERPGTARYLTTVFFFALGLMAKPMLMTLPAVLLLLDWWPLGRIDFAALYSFARDKKDKPAVKKPMHGAHSKKAFAMAGTLSPSRILLEKAPFIVLSLASLSITFIAHHQIDAIISPQAVSPGSSIANALTAYVLYLWKMLWPANLYVPYIYSGMQPLWAIIGACFVLAGLTFAAVKAARQRSYFLFGWLWYLGTLIPVIGFVKLGAQTMADRFTYIPLIGIFIIIAWGAAELSGGWRYRRAVLGSAAGVILAGLLACSYVQTGYWKDDMSLWTHTLACTPENYIAHNNLAIALAGQGRLREALEHYEQSLQLNPDFDMAHYNLGIMLAGQGRLQEALEHYERVLQLNPAFVMAHYNLGIALTGLGKLDKAIEHYEQALQLNPDYADAHYNLAVALVGQGRLQEAIEHYEQALQLNPDYADAHYNLGIMLAGQGRLQEALEHYERVLKLNPDFDMAHYNLGIMLAGQGRLQEALEHYERALQLNPDFADAHINLAVALAGQGRLQEALEHYERVLQLNPAFVMAHYNLGIALTGLGKLDKAIEHYERVLKLNPDHANAHYNLGNVLAGQGKLTEAIPHLQQALNLATAQNNTSLAESIRARLNSYEAQLK